MNHSRQSSPYHSLFDSALGVLIALAVLAVILARGIGRTAPPAQPAADGIPG